MRARRKKSSPSKRPGRTRSWRLPWVIVREEKGVGLHGDGESQPANALDDDPQIGPEERFAAGDFHGPQAQGQGGPQEIEEGPGVDLALTEIA